MSDKKRHLNPLLLLIAILLCLSAGFLFRRTSFDANYKIPARHSSVIKKSKVTPTPVLTQKPKANVSISATPTITGSSLLSLLLNPYHKMRHPRRQALESGLQAAATGCLWLTVFLTQAG